MQETFQVETSARRVLKEILSEFDNRSKFLRDVVKSAEDKTHYVAVEIDMHNVKLEKLTEQCRDVESFRKRLEYLESRFELYKDNTLQNV